MDLRTTFTTTYVPLPPLVTNATIYTSSQLISNVLLSNNPCLDITNVTTSTGTNFGSINGIGYFTNTNPTFPLPSGIVLSTGAVNHIFGQKTTTLNDGTTSWISDTQLENIILASTGQAMVSFNATKLEFDFTSLNEYMSFNFLFKPDEFGTFQYTFSDALAFLLTDTATNATTNIAIVPNTTTPISVVTIRDALYNPNCASLNQQFFGQYNNASNSATNFSEQTAVMTASSALLPNHNYHIKLVVADSGDASYDLAVFIQGGSFSSGPPQCSDKVELVAFVPTNSSGVKDSNEVNFIYGSFTCTLNSLTTNISSPLGFYNLYDSNPTNLYDFNYQLNAEFAPYYSLFSVNYNGISIPTSSGTQVLYSPITLTQNYNDVSVSIVSLSTLRPVQLLSIK